MVQSLTEYGSIFQHKKIALIGMLFFSTLHISAEVSVSANLFLGRGFSANIARELLMTPQVNPHSDGNLNGFFSATAVYQRAFNGDKTDGIGAYPFWSNINSMTIGDNSGDFNVDAYQFGLGPVSPTTSTISLNPVVYQAGSDFMFYLGAKTQESGIFFKIKSAISCLSIDPNLTESNPVDAVPYPGGAISLPPAPTADTIPNPALSMTAAFMGGTAQGDYRPMVYGLIDGRQSTGAHFSDIEMTLGYNIFFSQAAHMIALGARVCAPTGNLPTGVYVLEPINGRGGYFGVGAYLAGSFLLYEGSQEDHKVLLNFMSNGMHLCTRNVMRSYDLTANGYGSKYLLVADYQNGIYQSSIQNLVNLSTIESASSFAFEGDAAIALQVIARNFSWDVGYNVWGRSAEQLTLDSRNFNSYRYAILGRQGIGLSGSGVDATPSNAAQPGATINSSVAATTTVITSTDVVSGDTIGNATVAGNRISGVDAFNTIITGQYQAVSSKFFTKFGYTWKDSECCPFIGLIAEIESSNISNNALPQWALSLVGGVSL